MSNSATTDTATKYAVYAKSATPAELAAILGPNWGICRNTEANRERYGRCITHKQYAEAEREALKRRELTAN